MSILQRSLFGKLLFQDVRCLPSKNQNAERVKGIGHTVLFNELLMEEDISMFAKRGKHNFTRSVSLFFVLYPRLIVCGVNT